MTYTFIGNIDYINIEINKIKDSFDSSNISFYDLEENSIKEVIEDLNTYSLFGKKLVITSNIDKIDDHESLKIYIKNESDNTLILYTEKDISKSKTFSYLKDTNYKELFKLDLNDYIKSNLDGYKMSYMGMGLLISYTGSDILRIKNELDKLKLYKTKEKEITGEDIKKLVKKSLDSTIFNLIDYINYKNKEKLYKTYQELKEEGEDDEKIMYTIANHYRLLFQIKNKIEIDKMKELDIRKQYNNMHEYRFKKLKEQTSLLSNEEILNILSSLADIEIKNKKGLCDISTSLICFFERL